jgi:toxin ParE1/3/4
MSYCEGLSTFPHRATLRDDVRPGLRVTNYKGRTVIAFGVSGNTLSIFGIF